jgi:hypothetical protein
MQRKVEPYITGQLEELFREITIDRERFPVDSKAVSFEYDKDNVVITFSQNMWRNASLEPLEKKYGKENIAPQGNYEIKISSECIKRIIGFKKTKPPEKKERTSSTIFRQPGSDPIILVERQAKIRFLSELAEEKDLAVSIKKLIASLQVERDQLSKVDSVYMQVKNSLRDIYKTTQSEKYKYFKKILKHGNSGQPVTPKKTRKP